MSVDIEWASPPPPARRGPKKGGGRTQQFVAQLKTRPGEWAKYPTSMASHGSTSAYRTQHPGTEWVVRKREDGRYDLYGRWVGETES